jgi:APA family basic amino acid/polyamine antiporter
MLSCLLLMFSLPVENWYRLLAWMALGLVIYFSYSYSHSELRKRTEALQSSGGARRR